MGEKVQFVVSKQAGMRVDKALAELLPDMSRSYLQKNHKESIGYSK